MATARILVADDEDLMREYVEEALARAGYDVSAVAHGEEAIDRFKAGGFDVVVTDLKMAPVNGIDVLRAIKSESPQAICIVMTAYGTIETAVEALKEGAADYILKPFAPDELELAVQRALDRHRLERENRYLRDEVNERFDFQNMVGSSTTMGAVYDTIKKIANSRSTILVRGESGTGKELVARAIHYSSDRRDKPFIKVNCAALSAGLLESELFGHEKGAFTGAHERKVGRFELADGGTLLLDEISEIGLDLQPKLLRALQEREFERVGGARPISVDTRIIATSNRDLEKAVAAGEFREDLFFRLNVIPVKLPPLRQRPDDIEELITYFLAKCSRENGRTIHGFTDEAKQVLMNYTWPGNVRELQNTIERAVVLADSSMLTPDDFKLSLMSARKDDDDPSRLSVPVGTTVGDMERQLVLKTLTQCNDNRTRAAEILGVSVRTLRNKLKEYRERGLLDGQADPPE